MKLVDRYNQRERDVKLSKLLIVGLFLLVIVPYLSTVVLANPLVYTDDLDDATDDYFEYQGETVRIMSYSGSAPYTINVYRSPTGQSYPTPVYTGPWIFVTSYTVTTTGWNQTDLTSVSNPGTTWWKVEIAGTHATGTYFVIPQVPLGIITVLITCFATLGLHRLSKRKP